MIKYSLLLALLIIFFNGAIGSNTNRMEIIGKNIIANSSFDTDASGWTHYFDYFWDITNPLAAKASLSLVQKEGFEGNAYKITITDAGTQNYSVQISYPMPLVKGVSYRIKFKASADAPRKMQINLQQDVAPKTNWFTSENIALTEIPSDYGPYFFTATETDFTNLFKFYLGGGGTANGISAYFDNVEVSEVVENPDATVPDAPVMGTVTAGISQALVEFAPPLNTGGINVSYYQITSNPSGIIGRGVASPITVSGLSTNVAYTFTVRAINAMGPGKESSPSNTIVPLFKPNTYYVSAKKGNDKNDGKSMGTPLKTPQVASDLTLPGDTVIFMDDTYTFVDNRILFVKRSGKAENWIVYRGLEGKRPLFKVQGHVWESIIIDANYILLEGIELMGNNANLKLEDAIACEAEAENGGTDWWKYSIYNNSGITMGGNQSTGVHHITIRNCIVHDFPASGIGMAKADYLTVENNVVYNTSWFTMYATSGIGLWHTYNSDNSTDFKNFVRGNISYNNKTLVKWVAIKNYSDGNGIIIDDNKNTQEGALGGPYTGKTLVENNLCYNNGGSGLHAYSCSNVYIINNTAYHNGTEVAYPEIFQNTCNDGVVLNNIMYARNGGKVNGNSANKNIVYDYNIYFNGIWEKKGLHDKLIDPKFINPTTDPQLANFRLQVLSPAIDFGSSQQFPAFDISGIARPQGKAVDAGAYEYNTPNSIEELKKSQGSFLYPNPAGNILKIRNNENFMVEKVEILDAQGKSILVVNDLFTNEIDISSFNSGLYIVQLHTSAGRKVQQFIKM